MDLPDLDLHERTMFRAAVSRAMRPAAELPPVVPLAAGATLIVDSFTSTCSACGGNADPTEASHIHGGRGGAYDDAARSTTDYRNGCGARFTSVDDPFGVFTLNGGV